MLDLFILEGRLTFYNKLRYSYIQHLIEMWQQLHNIKTQVM